MTALIGSLAGVTASVPALVAPTPLAWVSLVLAFVALVPAFVAQVPTLVALAHARVHWFLWQEPVFLPIWATYLPPPQGEGVRAVGK